MDLKTILIRGELAISEQNPWNEISQKKLSKYISNVARVVPDNVNISVTSTETVKNVSRTRRLQNIFSTSIKLVIDVRALDNVPLICTAQDACNFGVDVSEIFIASNDTRVDFCKFSLNYPNQDYDCFGTCVAHVDCAGTCAGSLKQDTCGVCGGDGRSCLQDCQNHCCNEGYDCAGQCGGLAQKDFCGVCKGDNSTCRPRADSAIFSPTGSSIEVTFAQTTSQKFKIDGRFINNAFARDLFDDRSSALLGNASCKWLDDSRMRIILGTDAIITSSIQRLCSEYDAAPTQLLQAQLVFRSDVVQSFVSPYVMNTVDCIVVNPPNEKAKPFVSVEFSPKVGVCDDIRLDASAMVPMAGIRPLTFEWNINLLNQTHEYLDILAPVEMNTPILFIPLTALPSTVTVLRAIMTARTFFGVSVQQEFVTTRSSSILPRVLINFSPIVFRADNVELRAEISVDECNSATITHSHVNVDWDVRVVDVITNTASTWQHNFLDEYPHGGPGFTGFSTGDKHGLVLAIQPFALQPCYDYEFNASVGIAARDFHALNWNTARISQQRGGVHAIIDAVDMTISASESLVLSALKSIDEDGLDIPFGFEWGCSTYPEGYNCGLDNVTTWNSDSLHIPAKSLHPRQYTFSLRVISDAHRKYPCYSKEPRTSTDNIVVTVVAARTPLLEVDVCSDITCETEIPSWKGEAVVNYKKGNAVYVRLGTKFTDIELGNGSECDTTLRTVWTTDLNRLHINTDKLIEEHVLPITDANAGVEVFKFTPVLSEMVDEVFAFSIGVVSNCGIKHTSFVDLRIRMNSPPRVGKLKVGTMSNSNQKDDLFRAASTSFVLSHDVPWIDQQPPFKYFFGYVVGHFNAAEASQFGPLSDVYFLQSAPTNRDSLITTLPEPGRCGDRLLTIVVEVMDRLGARSTCGEALSAPCAQLEVHPYGGTQTELIQSLQETTKESIAGISTGGDILQAVMAVQKAFGADCLQCKNGTLKPDGTRGRCECNPGLFGQLCDTTKAWSDWSEWSSCSKPCGMGTRESTRLCKNVDQHLKDELCRGTTQKYKECSIQACTDAWSSWSMCSANCQDETHDGVQLRANSYKTESRFCVKYCPVACPGDNCSGHGRCDRTPPGCTDEQSCSAICKCNIGFLGTACNIPYNEVTTLQNSTEKLMDAVWHVLSIDTHSSCQQLQNILVIFDDIVNEDLVSLSKYQRNLLFTEINNTFLSRSDCISYLNAGSTRLVNLVPAFAESMHIVTPDLSSIKKEFSSDDNGEKQLHNVQEQDEIVLLRQFTASINNQLLEAALQTMVPDEPPRLVISDSVSRLAAVSSGPQAAFKVCTGDGFCAQYPRGSVTCKKKGKSSSTLQLSSVLYRTSINEAPPTPTASMMRSIGLKDCEIADGRHFEFSMLKNNIGDPRGSTTCQYWDSARTKWSSRGMILKSISLFRAGGPLQMRMACASTHMTDMQAIENVKAMLPQMNEFDPIHDSMTVHKYSLDNLEIPVIQGTILILFAAFMAFSIAADRKQRRKVQLLEKERFRLAGDVTMQFGNHSRIALVMVLCLPCHFIQKHKQKTLNLHLQRQLQASEQANADRRVSNQEKHQKKACKLQLREWWRKKISDLPSIIRAEHTIVGLAHPLREELAYFSRTQRLLCYFCEIQMAFAVNAFVVNKTQNSMQTAVVAIICIFFMTPITIVIPWMFQAAQTIISFTVLEWKEKHKELRRELYSKQSLEKQRSKSTPTKSLKLQNIFEVTMTRNSYDARTRSHKLSPEQEELMTTKQVLTMDSFGTSVISKHLVRKEVRPVRIGPGTKQNNSIETRRRRRTRKQRKRKKIKRIHVGPKNQKRVYPDKNTTEVNQTSGGILAKECDSPAPQTRNSGPTGLTPGSDKIVPFLQTKKGDASEPPTVPTKNIQQINEKRRLLGAGAHPILMQRGNKTCSQPSNKKVETKSTDLASTITKDADEFADEFVDESSSVSSDQSDDSDDCYDHPKVDGMVRQTQNIVASDSVIVKVGECASTPPDNSSAADVFKPKTTSSLVHKVVQSKKRKKDLNHRIREAEYEHFKRKLRPNRLLMLVLCYATLALFTALSLWINLIFGVKFNAPERATWIKITVCVSVCACMYVCYVCNCMHVTVCM